MGLKDGPSVAILAKMVLQELRLVLELDLEVIAEGIKIEVSLRQLRSLGCRWGHDPWYGLQMA